MSLTNILIMYIYINNYKLIMETDKFIVSINLINFL